MTVSPYAAVPMIADDLINRIRDEKIRLARSARDHESRGWLENCHQPVLDCG
jgi:hypothetical protein